MTNCVETVQVQDGMAQYVRATRQILPVVQWDEGEFTCKHTIMLHAHVQCEVTSITGLACRNAGQTPFGLVTFIVLI